MSVRCGILNLSEYMEGPINGTGIFFLPCKVGKIVYDLTLKLRLPDKAYKL